MAQISKLRDLVTKGQVLFPNDEGYDQCLKRWSIAAERKAAVVVRPTCAEEASSAVKFAVAAELPLAICGGGHSTDGSSSSEGMVIDLGNIRHVEVNKSDMTVEFGGGCLWADVDYALEKHGLATPGGAVNHTGVGGLILGGGHGWLTPRYGLTVDNLVAVEIVTADGSIVWASETEHSDLFWAVRGAGAQFGVVTRFVSRVHKQDLVWSGILAFDSTKLRELVAAANDFYVQSRHEPHALAMAIGYGPDGKSHMLLAIPFYHGPKEEAMVFFSKLLEIEALQDTTQMMSTAHVNSLINPPSEHRFRRLQGGAVVTMPLDPDSVQQTASMFWDFCDNQPGMGTSSLAFECFPTQKVCQLPLSATAYANRGHYFDSFTEFAWQDEKLDVVVRQFKRKMCAHLAYSHGWRACNELDAQEEDAPAPVRRYINFDTDPATREESWGPNVERLKVVKRQYDPHNVFKKGHGISL